jgi:hypothetical protein
MNPTVSASGAETSFPFGSSGSEFQRQAKRLSIDSGLERNDKENEKLVCIHREDRQS